MPCPPPPPRDLDFWKVSNDPQTHSAKTQSCVWGVGGRKELVMEALLFSIKDFAPAEGKEEPAKTHNSHFTWDLEETHTHRGRNKSRQVAKETCVNFKHRHISWPFPCTASRIPSTQLCSSLAATFCIHLGLSRADWQSSLVGDITFFKLNELKV